MLLSARRRFGHTHVRARHVLEVATPHEVSTKGLDRETEGLRRTEGEWLSCQQGDLVIEVVCAKKGKLIGYSYLCGPAIQVMNYDVRFPNLFEESVRVARVDLPIPVDEHQEILTLDVSADVNVFKHRAKTEDEAKSLVENLSALWGEQEKKHLLGLILLGKKVVCTHFQPPGQAGDYAATPFQVELLWELVR